MPTSMIERLISSQPTPSLIRYILKPQKHLSLFFFTVVSLNTRSILVYTGFFLLILAIYLLNIVFFRKFTTKEGTRGRPKINFRLIFKVSLIIFTLFLILLFVNIFSYGKLSDHFFLFFSLLSLFACCFDRSRHAVCAPALSVLHVGGVVC